MRRRQQIFRVSKRSFLSEASTEMRSNELTPPKQLFRMQSIGQLVRWRKRNNQPTFFLPFFFPFPFIFSQKMCLVWGEKICHVGEIVPTTAPLWRGQLLQMGHFCHQPRAEHSSGWLTAWGKSHVGQGWGETLLWNEAVGEMRGG